MGQYQEEGAAEDILLEGKDCKERKDGYGRKAEAEAEAERDDPRTVLEIRGSVNFSLHPIRKMKPRLPDELEAALPRAVVDLLYTFVPHIKKSPKESPLAHLGISSSPRLEKDLRAMQNIVLKGKSQMWLRDLEDFILT